MGNSLLYLKCDWSLTSPCITGPTVVPQYYGVAAAPWGVYPANIIQQGAAAAAQQRRPLTPSSASEISNSSTNLTQVCTVYCIQKVWLLVMLLVGTSREYLTYHTCVSFVSRDQNAGRIHSVRIDNSTFGRVEKFKYLGTSLTNQNSTAEEIKSRLRSGNAAIVRCRIFCLSGCYPKI